MAVKYSVLVKCIRVRGGVSSPSNHLRRNRWVSHLSFVCTSGVLCACGKGRRREMLSWPASEVQCRRPRGLSSPSSPGGKSPWPILWAELSHFFVTYYHDLELGEQAWQGRLLVEPALTEPWSHTCARGCPVSPRGHACAHHATPWSPSQGPQDPSVRIPEECGATGGLHQPKTFSWEKVCECGVCVMCVSVCGV